MIVDSNGHPVSGAADVVKMPDEVEPPPEPKKPRPYKPAPGKVLVKRHQAARFFEHGELKLVKHSDYVERDDAFEVYATVLAVGKQAHGGSEPWFAEGQDVTIEPSLFREINLTPDYSVWNGPFAGISGTFDSDE